jgi:hypothetical protein
VKLKLQENASSYLIGKGSHPPPHAFHDSLIPDISRSSLYVCLSSVLNKAGYGKTPEVRMNFCITLPKEAKRGTATIMIAHLCVCS